MMKQTLLAVVLLGAVTLTWAPRGVLAEESSPEGEAGAAGEKSAEAIKILEQADAAAREVTTVRFKASFKPFGVFVNFVGTAEGESFMEGWDAEIQRPKKFWVHMTTRNPGADQDLEVTGGGDGETYYLIDHNSKKAYEDLDPAVQGSTAQALISIGFANLVSSDPYKRDLEAVSIAVVGSEDVGGVDCHQVRVDYDPSDQSGEAYSVWSFGKKDFLPRKRVRHYNFGAQGEGGAEILLSKLKVNPKADPSLFKLKLPKGFEQIDDFAP